MARIENFRKGDRAEYLAQVFLSSISFSNPVYRQEDFGIDFICSLINKKKDDLFPSNTFNVQIKSSKKHNYIEFKKIKEHDLDWILNIQEPYFLGFIDTEEKSLSLYSTSLVFLTKTLKVKNYNKIRLNYDLNHGHCSVWVDHKLNKKVLEFNIGKPFIKLSFDDLKDENTLEERKKILKRVIEIERENIMYKNFNLPLVRWLHDYDTNVSPMKFGWYHLCKDEHKNINKPQDILNSIGQTIIALSQSYRLHKNEKMYNLTKELIQKLPFESEYKSYLINLNYFDSKGKKL